MSLSVFEWIATAEMALVLFLLWKLRHLLLEILNSLKGMSTTVEMTSLSYLGFQSPWKYCHKMAAAFPEQMLLKAAAENFPPIGDINMGEIFVEMVAELRRIRRQMEETHGVRAATEESDTPEMPNPESGGEKR